MNKDVCLTVVSKQIDLDGNENKDIQKYACQYYLRNDVHFVIMNDEITNQTARYKFNHRYLEVIKNGDISAKLYFEAGKDYTTVYRTPYGRLEFTFSTKQLTFIHKENEIILSVEYSILNNGGLVSNNYIELQIG